MANVQEYHGSSSGQLSLPATAGHRWHLDGGGPVDVVDLGFAVMTLPKGHASRLLNHLLPGDLHAQFVTSLGGDPDLATTRRWSHCSTTISFDTCSSRT